MQSDNTGDRINYGLAIGFLVNSIRAHGRKQVERDIESFTDSEEKTHMENLLSTAMEIIKGQKEGTDDDDDKSDFLFLEPDNGLED